ncbi:hypothetical protein GGR53DRAFT_479403 [Hypoxylon sp. FL1150]|nr:hypothetical protein GGR53DRAFT_479403 [Hypoxylon sp. FL1150]
MLSVCRRGTPGLTSLVLHLVPPSSLGVLSPLLARGLAKEAESHPSQRDPEGRSAWTALGATPDDRGQGHAEVRGDRVPDPNRRVGTVGAGLPLRAVLAGGTLRVAQLGQLSVPRRYSY